MKYGVVELHDDYAFDTPISYKELVLCKECRHCLVGVATAQYSNGKQRIENLCEKHKWSVRADDFCSYGERKSE